MILSNYYLRKISATFKEVDEELLISELYSLTYIANSYCKMANGYTDYGFVRNLHLVEAKIEHPHLNSFLGAVRNYSKEWYMFITDGHDIINLREYLEFTGTERKKILETLERFKEHAMFLQYALIKVAKEKNEKKRRAMIAGLMGVR